MMTFRTLICLAVAAVAPACAQDLVRHKYPGSDFPIAMAVEIPAGKKLVFVSGSGPALADKNAKGYAAYGDTATQTASTLEAIQANLKLLKLDMKDVVKMQVFLVGDPTKEGRMDFAGFMQAYRKHFGTAEQPNLPARTTVQVAGLPNPGWLVEIEVTVVAPN
jgi:enamine deaminase RidA (YjgF/YER057c/UK114 family)